MKSIRYILTIFIVVGILNLLKKYEIYNFDTFNYQNKAKVEINEEIIFQHISNENKNKFYDINLIEKEELKKLKFTNSEINKFLKYRNLVGYIDDISKVEKILKIKNFNLLIVKEKKEYNKHYIDTLSEKELSLLGFNKKEIKIIKTIIDENKGRKLRELDFKGKINDEILKNNIKFE